MNTILEQINSAGFIFVKFALPMLVQSSVLIVVLLLADLLLRKKVRAVFRYWLWMLVLLKLILPTTLSSPVGLGSWFGDELATVKFSESTPAEPATSPQMAQALPAEETGTPPADVRPIVTPPPGAEPVVVEVAGSPAVSPAPLTWQGIVFLVWAAVVAAMGLLLLQRAIFVTGLVAQAQNPTQLMNDAFRFCCGQMGIKGRVGLKVSANTASPAVCGLFKPVILVPENLAPTLGSGHLRMVLLHELAHISRGDLWINLAQTILQIIYFYNPLLWLANSIIRRIREQAVDEAVQVAMGDDAPQYPQTLVDIAKMAFNRPVLSLRLIGVVESKNALRGRIKRMLDRPIPKSAKPGVAGILAVFIIGAVLLPMARAEKYTGGEKTFLETLNEEQKLYMEWTQERFGTDPDKNEYTKLSEPAKKELEEIWIEILKGPERGEYYAAIDGLAAIKSKRAVEPLLKVAAERIEKDNRYRWQAVRALGIVGDDSVVPELIHLVYHYNQNTRFWAQISLVRLTGENFGADWQKWADWWNSQKGKPTCSTEKVGWTSNADWADPKEQKAMDEEFIQTLRDDKKGETDKSGDRAGQGPMVISTSPAVYDDAVSPELSKIMVTFDQPMMDKSWAWVRWDAPYPETVGSPYYDDEKKTCTLPVKLEAGQAYLVAFNVEPYIGFVNTAGQPAGPYVLVFATKGKDGKPTPIPEELITKAKSINERAEIPYTQEVFDDIQPDGTILFRNTIRQINRSDRKVTTEGFINSDFVHVTDMSDAKGRPLKFTSTHEEDIYRYEVTFNEPVLPGEVIEYTSEGTIEGLVKPVPASKDTFQYSMTHWPQAGQPARRVETYLLPDGAELISTTPEDMQRRTKDGRIELHVEKMIPTSGSITTAFQYRLTGVEGASKVSDKDKMASENLAAQGWALWQQRKLAEAEQVFEKAVLKDPANANAWNGLGWSQQNQGKALNAKVSFEKCLDIQPEHAAALNGLGWIAKAQGKTDEAIAHWEKAIEAAPDATAALNGLATTYMELKDYDKAVKYYKMWLKVEPDNADAKAGLQKAKSEKTKDRPDQQVNSRSEQHNPATSAVPADLQQLIDSARPGGTVTIPKSVYTEPIEITKSLTLKGQSRDDCIFEITADKPAIFIDTKGRGTVTIEDVTIKWQLATSDKKIEHPFAVAVKDTKAEVKNCSFTPLGNFKRCPTAIQAIGFSQLSINTCRFQGYEYTICYGDGAQGTVSNSLIMDSGHQGISLYEGTTVHIERNVVTGSAYHAVRSTGGTLFMKDNLIINNANRGVYLGNKSAKGTISNNIITGNETAIGGFAQSKVNIENNLILNSGYAGIGMEKSCSLVIKDNIFVNNERGWIMFDRGGNGANTCYRNTFWKNKVDAENFEKTADSITAEPRFADPDNGDFSLRAGPALEHKQGLTNPQVFKTLWKIWQNRANKNEPFITIGQTNLQVGSESEKAKAEKTSIQPDVEKTSLISSPPEQHNPVISVFPPSGSKMALISELRVVFDQPMMPEEFKIVDASLEEKFEDFSDVAVVRSYVVYNADKYQFSMPLILPCNWNGSIQLGGFKTAKGVEVEPIVLNYTTSRDKFSGDLLQRFEKAKQSRELKALLENVKNARSKLKSLSETVYYTYDFGDDEKSNKAIFKMQNRNQFYVDMSEEFEMPWHIGSDGEKCWFYYEHKDTKKLVAIDCDKIAEKKISICDPFGIAEADIDTVIKQNNVEYLGTEILDSRECHKVRSWLVEIEHTAACSIITWWFDSETYMPAKIVSDSGRWRVSYRFVYDRVNEPINNSEFRPEFVTKIEPQEPEPLDENYNTRFIRIIDGSSSGRMSINWGKYGPAGTSESGLN